MFARENRDMFTDYAKDKTYPVPSPSKPGVVLCSRPSVVYIDYTRVLMQLAIVWLRSPLYSAQNPEMNW